MKRVALLVGVEKYRDPGITPLAYAGADVLALGDRLSRLCGFDRVEVLAQSEGYDRPDSHNALRRFDELCAELDEDDLFLFYFSGHGVEWKPKTAPENEKPRMYLLTEDTFKTRPYQNSLSRELLSDALGNLAARRRILLFDACRNHPEKGKGDADNRMAEAVARDTAALARDTAVSGATTALYSACGQGKRSYEYCWRRGHEEEGHGVFTHFLLEGLDGAAWRNDELEFRSLVDHTSRNVRDWTRRMPGFREPQEPWYEEFGAGERIVLAGREKERSRKGAPVGGRVVILEPPRLHVTTRPAGARVWVDGRPQGQSPVSLELAAGEHTVRAELAGFAPWERRIRFDGEGDAPLDVALVALPKGPQSGEVRTFAGIEMVWCPPGEFMMGSPKNEAERSDNERQHRVTLTRGFWLGKYTVTQVQWEQVMGSNPSYFKGDARPPVESVSWEDCQAFIRRLNERGEGTFRLPTEAEWEYACRAGTTTRFCFGDSERDLARYAWFDGNNSGDEPAPVGKLRPNAWGLHDIHGNVWEWCADCCEDYPSGAVTDPTGEPTGRYRVLRGGSWHDGPGYCRSAARGCCTSDDLRLSNGFRLLRTP